MEVLRALASTCVAFDEAPNGKRLLRMNSEAFATNCPAHESTNGQEQSGHLCSMLVPWCISSSFPGCIHERFLQNPLWTTGGRFPHDASFGGLELFCGGGSGLLGLLVWLRTQMSYVIPWALCALGKRCLSPPITGTKAMDVIQACAARKTPFDVHEHVRVSFREHCAPSARMFFLRFHRRTESG